MKFCATAPSFDSRSWARRSAQTERLVGTDHWHGRASVAGRVIFGGGRYRSDWTRGLRCGGSSNLQRQVIHGTATIGKLKVESARDRMLDLNPDIEVEIYNEPYTSENALRREGLRYFAGRHRQFSDTISDQ